jgi:hypothetical protein
MVSKIRTGMRWWLLGGCCCLEVRGSEADELESENRMEEIDFQVLSSSLK